MSPIIIICNVQYYYLFTYSLTHLLTWALFTTSATAAAVHDPWLPSKDTEPIHSFKAQQRARSEY